MGGKTPKHVKVLKTTLTARDKTPRTAERVFNNTT